MKEAQEEPLRFLRMKDVMDLTGLSRTGIYMSIGRGEFPEPVKLGSKAIAFVESEVQSWMRDRADNHRARTDMPDSPSFGDAPGKTPGPD